MFSRVEEGDLRWLNVSNTLNHEVNLNVWKLSSYLTEKTFFSRVLKLSQSCYRGLLCSGIEGCFRG